MTATQSTRILHIPLIVSLFAILFLIAMSFMITAIASPYIVGDLGGDRFITTYALSFFGFGVAVSIPLVNPFASKCGIEKTFLYCILSFSCLNFLCGAAPTYFLFVTSRLLSGMAAGLLYPLLVHYFSCLVPSYGKSVILWIVVTILVVVPVVSACWGGSIAYLYNWRAIFFFNAVVGIVLTGIVKFYLKDVQIDPMEGGFDWIGWCFYAVGILCLSFAATTAQQLDWYRSPLLVAAVLIGIPTFVYYLIRCLTHETPVLHLRLFAKPVFSLAMLCLAIFFAIYFGMIVLLSIWLTLDVQFTPLWIATLLGTMGIAGLFPYFILEGRVGRIDPRILLILAAILLAISCFYTTTFDFRINFGRIACSRIIAGFGIALFLPPIFQILSQCYAPGQWIHVFEILQTIRNVSCGLGASIFNIVWHRRSVFYHERLNEKVNHQLNAVQVFFKKAETLQVPGGPLANLDDFLNKRSSTLALDDVFYLMGWILVGLFILLVATFFFKRDAFDISKAKYYELGSTRDANE